MQIPKERLINTETISHDIAKFLSTAYIQDVLSQRDDNTPIFDPYDDFFYENIQRITDIYTHAYDKVFEIVTQQNEDIEK